MRDERGGDRSMVRVKLQMRGSALSALCFRQFAATGEHKHRAWHYAARVQEAHIES